jgi:uncharacterized protein with GYD domain
MCRPSVQELCLSTGFGGVSPGGLESYYWMFGRYDGLAIFEMPESQTAAALSLAVTGSGAFRKFETYKLIEAGDFAQNAERAKGIYYHPPGT